MNMKALKTICYTICIICIMAGTVLTFSMIWGPYENAVLWKAWLSMGVLFFASAGTLVVSNLLGGKAGSQA
jgi:hypothetical protein